jgi:hypothetical protein
MVDPLQSDRQRSPRLHLQGHRRCHAKRRYTVFDALAGPPCRAYGDLGARGGKGALLFGATLRWHTFNYGYIGSRATGNEAGDYLVVGANWKGQAPAGIKKVFHSTTQFGLTIFRTQLFNPDDMPNVVKVQAGYKVQPLSAYLNQPAPPAAPAINFPKINDEMAKTGFFGYLDFALQFAPAGPEENEIRGKLARLGIGVGKPFDLKALSPEQMAAIDEGVKDGEVKLGEAMAKYGKTINGWQVGSAQGDRASTGCCAPLRPRRASTATTPSRPPTRWPKWMPPTSHSTAATQLHAHLPRRTASARECLLVGNHV